MADDFIPWWVPDDHPLRQPAPLPTVFRDPSTGRFTAEPHDDESTESAPPEDAAAAATDGVARDERGDHNGEGSAPAVSQPAAEDAAVEGGDRSGQLPDREMSDGQAYD